MKGIIKFVSQTGQNSWGYLVPDDGSRDVHFNVSDAEGLVPSSADAGAAVEFFDVDEGPLGRHARSFRLLEAPKTESSSQSHGLPGNELKAWAFIPYIQFRAKDGEDYPSVLDYLARLALPEKWHFGEEPDPRMPFPILDNYLTYTFVKLRRQGKVHESAHWSTFNTGLVDRLYDPIYALFNRNDRAGAAPWHFYDFCVPGKRSSGRTLTDNFDPLPEPARYFSNNFDMVFDTSKDIFVDYEHVILDGIRHDRFPLEFLREHLPEGFEWQDVASQPGAERRSYLESLSKAVESEARCMRSIKRRLEDAKILAEKRIRWNFKTAIPQYYPRRDEMSLLLPIALINDEVVDIALVVTQNKSGSYQGRTILPLDWAYKHARLICRPDSDWLLPQSVRVRREFGMAELSEDDLG